MLFRFLSLSQQRLVTAVDWDMDQRFSKLFNLTEEQAIAALDTPPSQVSQDNSRYMAAEQLANYPSKSAVAALIRAVQETEESLANRIVRRKSIETLGRLQASQALTEIYTCLDDTDCYTVENAVWAIGEIGTDDPLILANVAQLLERPNQTYRVILHTLAKLNYTPALEQISCFQADPNPLIASAAIAAICRLTGDQRQIGNIVALLQHPNVLVRRLSIQDLIDVKYTDAIPAIARCPVSLVFRLRGIRLLAEVGMAAGTLSFEQIQPHLEQVLRDHPQDLDLIHRHNEILPVSRLICDLYDTDFGWCYLATLTLLEHHAKAAPAALFTTYEAEAHNDYGAHFHVVKLLGWLKHDPAYELLVEALHNRAPQFQKSRGAAAIALGELGNLAAIPELHACLTTNIWDLKYAALMALEQLGDASGYSQVGSEDDWLIQAQAQAYLNRQPSRA